MRNQVFADKYKKRLRDLCQLIELLDGFRAFKVTDPKKIEKIFRSIHSKKLMSEWKHIRHGIQKLVNLPAKIPNVQLMMKLTAYLRVLIPLSVLPFTIATIFGLFSSNSTNIPQYVFAIFLIYPAATILYTGTELRIRRKIAKFEKEHEEQFKKLRNDTKNLVQMLIYELKKNIKDAEDKENYKVKLLFTDYKGIKIIKKTLRGYRGKKYNLCRVM
ncbi:hypothetical protein DRO97_08470 [Archaeoglobales archaeon]|nr:MAG: hypothetical protein DRO97_08470 [Archaeoglobales archaeon]